MKPSHCKNGTFYEHSIVKAIFSVEVVLEELTSRENSTTLLTCNSMIIAVLRNNVLLLKLKNSYRKTNKGNSRIGSKP